MLVKDIIGERAEAPVSIALEAPLSQAAETLKIQNIGALPVVDGGGALVGIVSERDIVHQLNDNGSIDPAMAVGEVMSKNIIDCDFDTPIETALRLMRMLHIRHLPVTDQDKPVGIVSLRDIAFWRMENIEDEQKKTRFSETGYWDYIEKSPDAVIVEVDGHVAFCNEIADRLFAPEAAEGLIGTPVDDLSDRDSAAAFRKRRDQTTSEGEWLPFVAVGFDGAGDAAFHGELTTTRIWWDGEPAVLLAIRDISKRSSEQGSDPAPPRLDVANG